MSKNSIIISIIAIILLLALGFGIKSAGSNDPLVIAPDEWVIGPDSAKVTIIEYSDYQCPACQVYYDPVKKIVEKYPNDVRLVFRHFPLSQHKNAIKAATYAESAGIQNKFWEMSSKLFQNQTEWENLADPTETFKKYGQEIGLDVPKLSSDAKAGSVYKEISKDQKSGTKIELGWTPTFVINGKIINNPEPEVEFERIILDEINRNSEPAQPIQ